MDSGVVAYVPIVMLTPLIAMGVWAGILQNRVSNAEKRQDEDRKNHDLDLAAEQAKREKDDRESRELFAKSLSDVRSEAQHGRETNRLEMTTLVQASSEMRAERLNGFIRDFERLEGEMRKEFDQTKQLHGAFTKALYTFDRRVGDIEREAVARGARGISEQKMTAIVEPPVDSSRYEFIGDRPPRNPGSSEKGGRR